MAKKDKLPIKIMGDAPCEACGKPGKIKRNSGGFLYCYCSDEKCGGGPRSTSKSWDIYLAKKITKWVDAKDRAIYLGGSAPAAAAAADPSPNPDPDPEPAPAPVKKPWWDKEVI